MQHTKRKVFNTKKSVDIHLLRCAAAVSYTHLDVYKRQLYDGPYEVSEVKMENSYVLIDLQTQEIQGTYNVTQSKRYYLHE